MDTATVRAAARTLRQQAEVLQALPAVLTSHSGAATGAGSLALELPALVGSAAAALQSLQERLRALSSADDAAAAIFERLDGDSP